MRLALLRRVVIAAALAVVASSAVSVTTASAGGTEPHCISPHGGFDLNEFHQIPERIIVPFCTTAYAGEKWAPTSAWITNTTHEVIPDGYVPSAPTPSEDFNNKVTGVSYVIDAGTRQERTYAFAPEEVLHPGLVFPLGGFPTTGIRTVFRPLSVGAHAVDIFVTLSADHWDGFDANPDENLVPAGEIHWSHYEFEVQPRRTA